MKVIFEFSGAIRRPFQESEKELEFEAGTTIKESLTILGYTEKEIRFLVAFKKEVRIPLEEVLREGDKIKILLPIGGG